ncbi:MAG: CooT family nickel-binding protein [Actinobacteria bacterium]|jgi:predicted RNA-binding protein|nr:CooT family nickel-binding protein [Actinomycetota bacterium]
MCEAAVYIDRGGELEKIMDDVVEVRPEEGKLLLVDVFGEQKLVSARIAEVELLDHRIVLREPE